MSEGPDDARRTRVTGDPVDLLAGTLVGLAGLLFLVEPVAGPVAVGNVRLRPVVLSGIALALGLTVGGVGYLARGRRRVGIGHAGSATGWILVVVATALGSGVLLWAGAVLIAGTGLYLVAQSRDLVE